MLRRAVNSPPQSLGSSNPPITDHPAGLRPLAHRCLPTVRTIHLTTVSCILTVFEMISLQQRLLDYLEPLTGERPDLAPEKATDLPLFLRERFDFQNIRLFGKRYVLALEKENGDAESPGEYENQIRLMQPRFTEAVALVLLRLWQAAQGRAADSEATG